jgi:RNA polymerase sigma-70 factor (ECF subfamily)
MVAAKKSTAPVKNGSTSVETPEIVAGVQAQDHDALEAVVHAYLPQIVRAARGAGLSAVVADDVAQETFITFFEKAPTFEGRSKIRTWIFGILYRKIAEARRGVKRSNQMDDIDEIVDQRLNEDGTRWINPPRPVDQDLYESEVMGLLDECLESVPDQQRMAFTLRELEDMDTPEICNILDVTTTNLGVLLFRARNRLRECLESKGVGEAAT